MNIIEKYLAAAAGLREVAPGEDITVNVELVVAHDVTGPMAIEEFKKIGVDRVFDPQKVVFVFDHIIPAATVEAKTLHNSVKRFQQDFGVILYDRAQGVIHQVVAEKHRVAPGRIVVGADSHTCTAGAYGAVAIAVGATELAAAMATGKLDLEVPETYEIRLTGELPPGVYAKDVILHLIGRFGTDGFTDKAVVYTGAAVRNMSLDDKMTISNMGIEMGAMISLFAAEDDIGTVKETYVIDLSTLSPSVACPHSPGNVKPVAEVAGTKITQVVIGSCTNGRLSDMRVAAAVLQDRQVHPGVTMLVVPASEQVLSEMEKEGLTALFRRAGVIVTNPGCGPCFGAHMGLAAEDDVVVSTTNRNFPGRMGHKKAQVYLASPRTAAESAVAGHIVVPGTIEPVGGNGQ
ncbi:MAG TPA: 3-isopropylmalate dehydratase/homoaconitate hydratase family large subunit [Clostridia bacterium]|nr:3-isopropylmalate dehydratase/homoaconitate hydratase family large subunit [Clostridia bacterium]